MSKFYAHCMNEIKCENERCCYANTHNYSCKVKNETHTHTHIKGNCPILTKAIDHENHIIYLFPSLFPEEHFLVFAI